MTIGASTYSAVAATDDNKVITFNFPDETEVNSENTLTFTVFALPQDITGLNLEFTLSDGSTRLAKLAKNGNAVQFGACAKNRIYTLAIPEGDWHLYLEADVQEWIDAQKSIEYGEADEDGIVVSASALEVFSGAASMVDRVEATLSGVDTHMKGYFSVYSPTNGKWRITLKGAKANHFTISTDPAGTTGTNAGNAFIEGNVDGRVIFTLTPTSEAASGDSVELWFTVVMVVGEGEAAVEKEYLLHSEVTRSSLPLTVKLP